MSDFLNLQDAALAVARTFPWYKQLLREAGNGAARPPLLTASRLEPYDAHEAEPAASEPCTVYRTSGTSSGRRRTIRYSAADEQRYIEIKSAMFRSWLTAGGVFPMPVRTVLSDMGTGHAAATAPDVFRSMGLQVEAVPYSLPIGQHLERIRSSRPDVLYTMPSLLERIVRHLEQPSRHGIRKVILVGEIATPSWQRRIADRLGIAEADMLDTYGSIEIGTIASYSHVHRRYVIAEGLQAEAVPAEELDEGFDPLPPNERVLVLTSFVREAFPAVRYVTYDVVRDFRPIRIDGVIRQSFACIVKRIGPELKHGEKISLYDIEEAVLQHAPDAVIHAAIRDRRLTIHVASRQLTDDQLPAVREAVESRIPEIGAMIRGGLLERIEVTLAADEAGEPFARTGSGMQTGMKTRKIHYPAPSADRGADPE